VLLSSRQLFCLIYLMPLQSFKCCYEKQWCERERGTITNLNIFIQPDLQLWWSVAKLRNKKIFIKSVKQIIIIMLGTARGIAKSKIIQQEKRQERVRKCVRSGFFPRATQTQGKWKKKKRDFFEPKRFSHLLKVSTLSIHIALFFCRILLHIQPKSGCNLSRKRPATPNCVRLHSHEIHCCTNAKLI